LDERPLLQTPRHPLTLLLRLTPALDQPVRCLALARATFRLAPRRRWVTSARGLALAAAERVIDRVHHDPAHMRPATLVPRAAGLAPVDELPLGVADLTDGRAASCLHQSDLSGRHA